MIHQLIRRVFTKRVVKNSILSGVVLMSVQGLAITYGEADGGNHPQVGGLVNSRAYADGTWIYCTGTLISPTVFLTAAHCNLGTDQVRVTFSSKYQVGDVTHTGKLIPHPGFGNAQNDPHDIAVVVFDLPVQGIAPAKLPVADSLSDLARGQKFDSVGYGAHEVTNGPGGHELIYDDSRSSAVGSLSAINNAWLRISQNPALDNGGTCYGDSGGPNFLKGGDIIAGLTVTGDAFCKSRNVVYRLDTQDARDFLKSYVNLP